MSRNSTTRWTKARAAFGEGEWPRRVVKPAYREMPESGEVIVTSAMDHVLGQFWAAWHACRVPEQTHGVATHHLFAPDAFSERVSLDGCRLVAPGGTGLGFDDLLEGLPWKRL